jgi:hypothetical protein
MGTLGWTVFIFATTQRARAWRDQAGNNSRAMARSLEKLPAFIVALLFAFAVIACSAFLVTRRARAPRR